MEETPAKTVRWSITPVTGPRKKTSHNISLSNVLFHCKKKFTFKKYGSIN